MVQSFMEFCGNSSLWDRGLLLDSSYPHFTDCFQNTLLVWIPCGLVWLSLPFYVYHTVWSTGKPLPWTALNIVKSLFSILLFLLSGADILFGANDEKADMSRFSTAYYTAGSVKAATFLLAALIVQVERRKGVLTSGVLFTYWLLSTVTGIVPFYTLIIQKVYKDEILHFALFYVYYALVLVQLVLSSFAEKQRRIRGYCVTGKPQSPEMYASFPSKLSFWWITSLVVKAFRSGINQDKFWELHPRDQSANILPGFHKAWQSELQKYRSSVTKKKHRIKGSKTALHYQAKSEKASFVSAGAHNTIYDSIPSDEKGVHQDGVQHGGQKKGPSLLKVIVRVFGKYIFLSWLCKLVYDCLQFVNPMILDLLIGYVQSKNENGEDKQTWEGYIYATGLFVVTAIQSIFYHQNFHLGMTAGMRIKSALISAVYNKALTMNSEARKTKTLGEIVNLMSVDCQRIQDITGSLWMLWSAPLQVTLAMLLLYNTLGWSMLSGLGVLVLLMPVNALIATKMRKLQMLQMRYKDQRLKLISEVLNGIKVLKLYAWEPSFEKQVQEIRQKELDMLRKNAYLNSFSIFFWGSSPFLVLVATFATYIFVDDTNQLDAQKAFVSLSLFNILRFPINQLPRLLSYIVEGNVSLGRISKFLQAGDLDPNNIEHRETAKYALSIQTGTFSWDREDIPTLKDINLDVLDGKLVAVVGQVGAGKSSLVSALLGEMEKIEGKVKVKGSVAYVSQQAWIQNASLKANILFGNDVQQDKYNDVIDGCALQQDLGILPDADLTEIGEKGINLSGGQKQRVSLARAVYHNADIYLLDDPLSAVDSHVGKHIFNKVIGPDGLLKNKTRILVTHGVHWLPMVDQIVVMVNGKISELGSYEELLSHDGAFAQFLKMYLTQMGDDDEEEDPEVRQMKNKVLERAGSLTSVNEGITVQADNDNSTPGPPTNRTEHHTNTPAINTKSSTVEKDNPAADTNKKTAKKLIEAEKAETGKVLWKVYMRYFSAIGSLATLIILSLFVIYRGAGIGNSIWLSKWTDDKYLMNSSNAHTTEYKEKNYMYLGLYGGIGLGQAFIILIYALIATTRMVRAGGLLHNGMLANVLKLPMTFFDTTPLGRVVNRFSRDVETIDNNLPSNMRAFLNNFFDGLSTLVVIAYSTPVFLSVVMPIGLLYYLVQRFYIPTSRQLKRIESTTRSPIYSHFGESIAGVSTIRGYGVQERFMDVSRKKVDDNLVFYFAGIVSNRWLGWRLEILGNMVVFSAAIFAVVTPGNTGGLVGLSLSYALQVTSALNCLVRNISDVETSVVSVERVAEYTEEPTEADWLCEHRPASGWPDNGNVRFNNYSTRYREGLDLVLNGISCDIVGGERIGIVGRTGAGKTSLTMALFRIIESAGGNIVIDGERISDMGLHDLRSKITVLPQDPVLFSGSLRMNLDPFDDFTDNRIWQALEHAHLKNFVSGLSEGLGHECGEGGHNLSVGQRQLVCLARTLLRKTKILVLDEATAAVDMDTDDLIQKTIREEFKGCTILTIAHRLNTIMDYDRVMVLDQGTIKEFDSPQTLLEDSSTIFHGLAKDANLI